jgi:hypothetical protein
VSLAACTADTEIPSTRAASPPSASTESDAGPLSDAASEPAPSATDEPTLEPEVVVTDRVLLVPAASEAGLLGFQVVATIENTGDGWAKLFAVDSQWVALDSAGGVTATGQMSQAYPQYLEPGGTAYLATYDVREGTKPEELASVEVDIEVLAVPEPAVTFEFENTQVRYDDSYGLGGTGFVTSSADRNLVEVGVICLDAGGRVLGVANAQIMDTLEAGERHAFETTGPPSQVLPDSCASTVIQATAHDF